MLTLCGVLCGDIQPLLNANLLGRNAVMREYVFPVLPRLALLLRCRQYGTLDLPSLAQFSRLGENSEAGVAQLGGFPQGVFLVQDAV